MSDADDVDELTDEGASGPASQVSTITGQPHRYAPAAKFPGLSAVTFDAQRRAESPYQTRCWARSLVYQYESASPLPGPKTRPHNES